ncbi:Uncharacterised protein [Serratia sp. 2880STDY5682894]|nr:Uncharacterised protein [Serratia sp. 2880STDY5682894]
MPKASKPPITPDRISSSGRSAPMRISTGRSTLSSVATTQLQTSNTVPQVVSPCQYSQMMAGTSTNSGPNCATQQIKISIVNRVAAGMPLTARPIPPSTDCTSAVTTTPSATARIAWPPSSTAASPRAEPRRTAKWRIPSATCSPRAYSNALNSSISAQCSSRRPICAACATNQVAVWPKYGCTFASSAAPPALISVW